MEAKLIDITSRATKYQDYEIDDAQVIKTGRDIFDEWFSRWAGMVLGTSILVSSQPGMGKTTLMVNLQSWIKEKSILYTSEQDKRDLILQTNNIKKHKNSYVADDNDFDFNGLLKELQIIQPKVLILDSLQSTCSISYPALSENESYALILDKLIGWARETNGIVFIIGHSTKDGTFAGPQTILHTVDAHMELKMDKNLRYMVFDKNRKGISGERIIFDFGADGIELYSESEWFIGLNKERYFLNIIKESIKFYLDTIDKKHENYHAFKKNFNSSIRKIWKLYEGHKLTNYQYIGEYIKLVYLLSKKYSL